MQGERIFLGWSLSQHGGPLAMSRDGHHAAAWPWETVPHALLVGSTGGGKSTLLRVMATGLIRTRAPFGLVLVDGKAGASFLMFDHVAGVATASGPAELADAVEGVHQQMTERLGRLAQARQQAAATRGPTDWTPPPWLHLWVDEYLSGLMQLDDRARTRTVARLVDIGLRGREPRIRLLLAAQRPDAKAIDTGLPGLLKAELKARIAAAGPMGLDSVESRMAFDDAGAGERVPLQVGGGLLRVGRHEVAFKTPWLADPTSPETSEGDRAAAWRLLPRPARVEGAL